MHRWYKNILFRWKIISDWGTNNENIKPGHRNGICHWELCHADNEIRKIERTEGKELLNQEIINKSWRGGDYKELDTLEVETIKKKKTEIKWKNKKQCYRAEISLIIKHLVSLCCEIYRTLFKIDMRWTVTIGPKEKEKVADALWTLPERWHRHRVWVNKRGVASMLDFVDASIKGLKKYIKNSKERQVTET